MIKLSKTEKKVIALSLITDTNKEIAETLGISLKAVKFHYNNIFKKTNFVSKNDIIEKYTLALNDRCDKIQSIKKHIISPEIKQPFKINTGETCTEKQLPFTKPLV